MVSSELGALDLILGFLSPPYCLLKTRLHYSLGEIGCHLQNSYLGVWVNLAIHDIDRG